ncbi:MAG: hypothetical protein ACJAQ6_000862 [Arenicella sp.]|jgi:hypothetical protein
MNNKQFLIAALGLGILLRLALMPFFAHVDLFSEARRVFYVLENDFLFDNSHRFVVFYIEVIFAWFSTLFINITEGLFHIGDPSQSVSDLVDYGFFLNDPNIYRHLFFFKLPYLVFDIGTALLIWKFIDNPQHRKIALLLWLFNPLTLFSTYIFGRFEVISLFFLMACALQLKYDRVFFASALFAIALLCREINLLYAPFLLLALIDFKDHWLRNVVVLATSAAIIAAIYLLPNWLINLSGGNTQLFVDPTATHGSDSLSKLLSLGYYWFYPIVIGLAALAIYQWEIGERPKAERFILCASVVLFIYFGFNVHSVHYAAWLVLFPILSIQYGKKVVLPFIALFCTWLVLWLLKTDSGVFTLFLAAPLTTDFIGMGHFPSFFEQKIAGDSFTLHQAIQLVRSLFLVVMGFFAYRVLKAETTS